MLALLFLPHMSKCTVYSIYIEVPCYNNNVMFNNNNNINKSDLG